MGESNQGVSDTCENCIKEDFKAMQKAFTEQSRSVDKMLGAKKWTDWLLVVLVGGILVGGLLKNATDTNQSTTIARIDERQQHVLESLETLPSTNSEMRDILKDIAENM